MAFPRLDIVAVDETTVLWSFNDQLGTVNPNSVKAKLGSADFRVGTEITTAEYLAAGGQVSGYRDPVATASLSFYPAAATADALATGLGVLNKLLERGGTMIWQPLSGSPLRYIDFLASPRVSVYQGQHVPNLASVDDGISLSFLMQPYLRGALVTVGPTNVPQDPASSGGRIFPITVTGDLKVPVSLRINMDSGSTVERVHISHRAQGGEASTTMTDYDDYTAYAQCETNGDRAWGLVLVGDTSATTDTNASPGSSNTIARCTFATDPTVRQKRVRLTRTSQLDSLRGQWDVWLRCKASAAALFDLQLRWGPSGVAEPVAFNLDEVSHDTRNATSFGYVELKLGKISIPPDVTLGGLTLEVWARRASGTGNLDMDYLFLTPHDNQATVFVPGAAYEKWLGKNLVTPVTNPASGTAGTVVGTSLRLDTLTDNAGVAPNGGIVFPVGRHRVTFTIRNEVQPASGDNLDLRVRNITAGTDAVTYTAVEPPQGVSRYTVSFDANGTSFYQIQVDNPTVSPVFRVEKIEMHFSPSLASGHSIRTEPGERYSVDRLDSSATLAGYLGVEGEIPAVLEPGLNHVMIRCDEIPLPFYNEGQHIRTRNPAVTATYAPRYAL